MNTMTARVLLTIACLLAAGAAWAAVIVIALQVSQIVLNSLHQIVELAGI
jgi:hypothetical protein